MNYFPDKLRLEDAGMRGDSRVFRLERRFRYVSSFGVITVPEGTETDGASIPRAFWSILSPFGEWFAPAVIHDFLYSPANLEYTRAEADEIFREAMFNVGIPWPKRELIYRAVRLFGGRCFRGNPSPES